MKLGRYEPENLLCPRCLRPMKHKCKVRGAILSHERWECTTCGIAIRVSDISTSPRAVFKFILSLVYK